VQVGVIAWPVHSHIARSRTDYAGQDAIDDDCVDRIAEEGEIGDGARPLLQHHFLRIQHHPVAGDLRVAKHALQFAYASHKVVQPGDGILLRHKAAQQHARQTQRGFAPARDPADIPLERFRHGQEADRLSRRRGVDDDAVEASLARLAIDVEKAHNLLHAGDDGHLLCYSFAHALLPQRVADKVLHLAPVLTDFFQDVDLLGEKVGGDLFRFRGQSHVQAIS